MLKYVDRSMLVALVPLIGLWLSTVALVYGADLHVLGIVAAIDGKHIEVKTAKGPVISVLLSKQVKFKNKSNPQSNNPPTLGDRVIIEAVKDDKSKKVTATIIHYSPVGSPLPPR